MKGIEQANTAPSGGGGVQHPSIAAVVGFNQDRASDRHVFLVVVFTQRASRGARRPTPSGSRLKEGEMERESDVASSQLHSNSKQTLQTRTNSARRKKNRKTWKHGTII